MASPPDPATVQVSAYTQLTRTTQTIESSQPAVDEVPTRENAAHHPSLTLAIVCVSFGWRAIRRISTAARSAKVDPELKDFLGALNRRQVAEEWCRCGGSIESISVVGDSFREEQLLHSLLVVKRRLDPQV